MNITFLIGNGFDLNCGLNSSYSNVNESYIKQESKIKVIQSFKERMNKDFNTWGNFEIALGKDFQNFNNENDFLLCLDDYCSFLDNYLQLEEKAFFDRIRANPRNRNVVQNEFYSSISNFYANVTNNFSNMVRGKIGNDMCVYNAIVFNYTNIFSSIWKTTLMESKPNGDANIFAVINEPIKIHGGLNNEMILGIDNLSQLSFGNIKPTYRLKRAIVKPELNKIYDSNRVSLAKTAIKESDIICVFGMSFGDSDQTWKKAIIDWLKDNDSHQLVFYDYKLTSNERINLVKKLDIMELQENTFNSILKAQEEDYKKIIKQIKFPCSKNIFNIDSVIEKKVMLQGRIERVLV